MTDLDDDERRQLYIKYALPFSDHIENEIQRIFENAPKEDHEVVWEAISKALSMSWINFMRDSDIGVAEAMLGLARSWRTYEQDELDEVLRGGMH